MKYILIDQTMTDSFDEEFNNLEEAIKAGDRAFDQLTEHDKKQRTAFYLLESINPDESAENHYDGNIVKEWM